MSRLLVGLELSRWLLLCAITRSWWTQAQQVIECLVLLVETSVWLLAWLGTVLVFARLSIEVPVMCSRGVLVILLNGIVLLL